MLFVASLRPESIPMRPLALALAALVLATGLAVAQQRPVVQSVVTCENLRGSKLSYIDNPMAASGINRRLQKGEDDLPGVKLELIWNNDNADATLIVIGGGPGVKAGTFPMKRFGTSEMVGMIGTDPEDGGTSHLLSFNYKINKAIWTVQSDKSDGRDKASFVRTVFADCTRPRAG